MSVQFADTAQLYIFERYEDSNGRSVAHQELWYTPAEYDRMHHAVLEAVLEVRRRLNASGSNSAGNHDENEDMPLLFRAEVAEAEGIGLPDCDCIGIEHLLTRATILEVRTCKARCIQAVLEEQERQSASLGLGWNAIALSSLTQTRRTTLRAQMLGERHRESSI